jgi:Copine
LIITDGVISDFRATIDEIVRGSFNPLSIIIVGLGNHPFEEME